MDYQQNFLSSLAGGLQFGQDLKRQRDQTQLKGLASLAYGTPPEQRQSRLAEMAKLDPGFAQQQQKAWNAEDDRDQQELVSMARFIKNAPPEQQAAAYTNVVLPKLRARGMQAPDWAPDTQETILETVNALTQWDDDPSDTPSGYREFELLTKAADYKPGTADYQRAARIRMGTEARPATGGFSFESQDVLGDGKLRPVRRNPRTGAQEYYDERSAEWYQLGDAGNLGGGGGTGVPGGGEGFNAGGDGTGAHVNIEGIDPAEQQRYANIISTMRAANFSDDDITAWLEEALSRRAAAQEAGQIPTSNASGPTYRPNVGGAGNGAPVLRAPAGVGASRAKEDEAAAIEAAKIREQLAAARDVGAAEADAAALKTTAEAEAKRVAEARTLYSQVENNASQMLTLIDQARSHPGRAVATGLSGSLDPRNMISGTNAKDFRVLLDQMQGKSFLEAFNSLRGGGQITEAEGKKATEAIGRLNTAQSDAAFIAALDDLEGVILSGLSRAQKATQQRAATGNGWSIVKKGQ